MKAALRDAMNRHFGDMKIRDNLIAATLLDPRFKDMYFSSHEMENAKRVILSFLESQRTAAASTMEISHDDNSQPQLLTSTAPSPGSSPGLWDFFDNAADSTLTESTATHFRDGTR